MKPVPSLALAACCALIAACSSTPQTASQGGTTSAAPAAVPAQPAASPFGLTRVVKSRDGTFDGEIVGTPARNSKFAKLQIGMQMEEVTALIGGPDNMARHETGKRWIPFYFGSDAQRVQALYRGEGCLTYTAGNVFGGGGNTLIRITATPLATCME
ncbi:MAG: hypothetical protein ACXWUL_02500 [Caldimonas sp.]